MHLHSDGQQDYIKDLKKQRAQEISEVEKSHLTEEGKFKLIHKIKARFKKLIMDSDQSLFIGEV